MRRLPATSLLGCASITVDFIGLGMIAPILPGIVSSEGVGNILTAQYLAVVVGQLMVGVFADYFGRRQAIVVVMTCDAIFFAASAFSKDVTVLICLRVCAGLASPVALGISYVAAVSHGLPPAKAQFNFALVGISFNLGNIVGAAIGGLLGPEHWFPANLTSGVVPALVAVWALLSENVSQEVRPTAETSSHNSGNATNSTATSTEVVDATTSVTAKSGLRRLCMAPEFLGILLAYMAQGAFQGAFFSLMPILLHQAETPGFVVRWFGGEDSAPLIAAVIIVAGILQILSNFILVRPSLRYVGSHGHAVWTNCSGALLLVATGAIVGTGSRAVGPAFVGLVCAFFPVAYVCSATCLTVLNQATSITALRYGTRVGTATGIARSIFAASFGAAPAGSIALYGVLPWLPFAVMAVVALTTTAFFIGLKVSRCEDPIPPAIAVKASSEEKASPRTI